MASPACKAVLFDLGRVLVDFDHWIAVNKLSSASGLKPQRIFDIFFDSPYTRRFEEGEVSPEEFFAAINKELLLDMGISAFADIWNSIFFMTPDNLAVCALARKLKAHCGIFVISNINLWHYEYLAEKFDIFGMFDGLVLSFRAGAQKPKKEIYDAALKLAGCGSHEVVYIDDRADLTAKAAGYGIRSLTFTGAAKLKLELSEMGLGQWID